MPPSERQGEIGPTDKGRDPGEHAEVQHLRSGASDLQSPLQNDTGLDVGGPDVPPTVSIGATAQPGLHLNWPPAYSEQLRIQHTGRNESGDDPSARTPETQGVEDTAIVENEGSPNRGRGVLRTVKGQAYRHIVYPISKAGFTKIHDGIGEGVREGKTFPQAVDTVFDGMHARLTFVPDSDETQEALRSGSGLFGGNSIAGSSFQYMRGVAKSGRETDDAYFVDKASTAHAWASEVRDKIIPVYLPWKEDTDAVGFLPQRMRESPDLEELLGLTDAERRERNVHAMEMAAEVVRDGGLVTIFPAGGRGAIWRPGLGMIVQGLGDEGRDANLVMAHMQGATKGDKYKLAPVVNRIRPVDIRLDVTHGKIGDLLSDLPADSQADPRAIATHLKGRYDRWTAELTAKQQPGRHRRG